MASPRANVLPDSPRTRTNAAPLVTHGRDVRDGWSGARSLFALAFAFGALMLCLGLACGVPTSAFAEDDARTNQTELSGSPSAEDDSLNAEEASDEEADDAYVSDEEYGYNTQDDGDYYDEFSTHDSDYEDDEDAGVSEAADADGADTDGADDADGAADADEDEPLPDYSKMTLKQLKAEVNAKTDERDELDGLLQKYAEQTAEVIAHLQETAALLTEHLKLAEHSVRERYKVQRQYPTLIDAVLCSEDWQSFIAGIEYIEAASKASVSDVSALRAEVAKYERDKTMLQEMTAATEKKKARVEAELEAATKARDEAQRKADLVANAKLTPDGAKWKGSEEDFIEEWAPRIDAYFAGTPMADTGEYFAKAAWDNYIDPRFSPAISNIESSKGAICIRPHNAWGWGAAEPNPAGLASEWSSWEEAINAHVAGLAAGYGYTITKKGAKKYCPPNWEIWYATTVDQMNSI